MAAQGETSMARDPMRAHQGWTGSRDLLDPHKPRLSPRIELTTPATPKNTTGTSVLEKVFFIVNQVGQPGLSRKYSSLPT